MNLRRTFSILLVSGAMLGALPISVEALRDPTRPPADPTLSRPAENHAAEHWQLSSILISPQRRIAVINGRSLQVGQSLAGARVLSIEADQVVLRQGERTHILRLNSHHLKTPTPVVLEETSHP